jgi:hypothetical protein
MQASRWSYGTFATLAWTTLVVPAVARGQGRPGYNAVRTPTYSSAPVYHNSIGRGSPHVHHYHRYAYPSYSRYLSAYRPAYGVYYNPRYGSYYSRYHSAYSPYLAITFPRTYSSYYRPAYIPPTFYYHGYSVLPILLSRDAAPDLQDVPRRAPRSSGTVRPMPPVNSGRQAPIIPPPASATVAPQPRASSSEGIQPTKRTVPTGRGPYRELTGTPKPK